MAERFPVLITGTTKYVVWVEAEDADQAHRFARECESDYVEGEQPVDGWLDAEEKPEGTARFVWLYGREFLPQHDAHVHTHRWAMFRAAEAVSG